jgi:hypothetical protein
MKCSQELLIPVARWMACFGVECLSYLKAAPRVLRHRRDVSCCFVIAI